MLQFQNVINRTKGDTLQYFCVGGGFKIQGIYRTSQFRRQNFQQKIDLCLDFIKFIAEKVRFTYPHCSKYTLCVC